jgi:hypothetical protein
LANFFTEAKSNESYRILHTDYEVFKNISVKFWLIKFYLRPPIVFWISSFSEFSEKKMFFVRQQNLHHFHQCFLEKEKSKFFFTFLGSKIEKIKVFSWVVVYDFRVISLYQKVYLHHEMYLYSTISSQNQCYTSQKHLNKTHNFLQIAKFWQVMHSVMIIQWKRYSFTIDSSKISVIHGE